MSARRPGDAASQQTGIQHGLTASVVMATFNGAEYLEEQLTSLSQQTRLQMNLSSMTTAQRMKHGLSCSTTCQITFRDEGFFAATKPGGQCGVQRRPPRGVK